MPRTVLYQLDASRIESQGRDQSPRRAPADSNQNHDRRVEDSPWRGAAALQNRITAILDRGFDGIELPISTSSGSPGSAEAGERIANVDFIEKVRSLLPASARLAVAARCEITTADQLIADLADLIPSLGRSGVSLLSVSFARGDAASLDYGLALSTIHTALRELRHCIEASGVNLALEAASDGLLTSPLEMRELIDAANSHAIGARVDLDRVAPFSHPSDWIATLGRRLHCVRVADHRRETIDPMLDAIGFDGTVVIAGPNEGE